MNDLLVNKEAIRLKYKNDFGKELPVSLRWVNLDIQEYINWLEGIVSEVIRKDLLK